MGMLLLFVRLAERNNHKHLLAAMFNSIQFRLFQHWKYLLFHVVHGSWLFYGEQTFIADERTKNHPIIY